MLYAVCTRRALSFGFRRDGEPGPLCSALGGTTVTVSQGRFALRLGERLVDGGGVSFNRVRYLCRCHVRTAVRIRISVHAGGARRSSDTLASRHRVLSSTSSIAQHHRFRTQLDTSTSALEGAAGRQLPHQRSRRHHPHVHHRRTPFNFIGSAPRSTLHGRGAGSS